MMKAYIAMSSVVSGGIACLIPLLLAWHFDNGVATGSLNFTIASASSFYGYAMVTQLVLQLPLFADHLIDCVMPLSFMYGRSFVLQNDLCGEESLLKRPFGSTFLIGIGFLISILHLSLFIPSEQIEIVVCTYYFRHLLQYYSAFMRIWMFAESVHPGGLEPCRITLSFLLFTSATVIQCWSAFVGSNSLDLIYTSIALSFIATGIISYLCYTCWNKIRHKSWQEMTMFERDGVIMLIIFPTILCLNSLMYVVFMGSFTAEALGLNLYFFQILPFSRALFERRNLLTETTQREDVLTTKRNFVRMVSHEIRTPLNVVYAGLDLIRVELTRCRCRPEAIETWNDIKNASGMSVGILDELLTYEKLESGVLQLEIEKVQIWPFIRDCVKGFNILALQKGIILKFDMCEEMFAETLATYFVFADPAKLSQVVRNFVSNAIKFTSKGGLVSVNIEVLDEVKANGRSKASRSKTLRVSVKDSGVGISKENLSKLFTQVVQFQPGKLQGGGGSGLGLWIAKRIMDLHEGNVKAESDGEGLGCVFTFELDAVIDHIPELSSDRLSHNRSNDDVCSVSDFVASPRHSNQSSISLVRRSYPVAPEVTPTLYVASPCPAKSDNEVMDGPFFSRDTTGARLSRIDLCINCRQSIAIDTVQEIVEETPELGSEIDHNTRILIVDDAPVNLKVMRRLLQTRYSHVMTAEDGLQGLTIVQRQMEIGEPFHFILMDYQMPVMDGPTAVKEMRAAGFTGVIIGVTGNGLPEDKQKFLLSGANKILLKPVESVLLFDELMKFSVEYFTCHSETTKKDI